MDSSRSILLVAAEYWSASKSEEVTSSVIDISVMTSWMSIIQSDSARPYIVKTVTNVKTVTLVRLPLLLKARWSNREFAVHRNMYEWSSQEESRCYEDEHGVDGCNHEISGPAATR